MAGQLLLSINADPAPDPLKSQWDSPAELGERIAAWCGNLRGARVVEPSAGIGRLALPFHRRGAIITCVEIDPGRCRKLVAAGLPDVRQGDWLRVSEGLRGEPVALIPMNPPYENGQDAEHVGKALELAPRVVALVQLHFLAGLDRYDRIWRLHGLRRLAILKRRPDFGGPHGGGTRDFAVFDIERNRAGCATQVEWW